MSEDLEKKDEVPGQELERAIARVHLEEAGLTMHNIANLPAGPRFQPLREALKEALAAETPAGLTEEYVKKLAGV